MTALDQKRNALRISHCLLAILFGTTAALVSNDQLASAADAPATRESASKAALKGLDPVLLVEGKETPGSPDIVLERGRFRYQFASVDTKARFQAEPNRYAIQLNGRCGAMRSVNGDPDLFAVYRGGVYIFGTEQCRAKFLNAPAQFLKTRRKVAILIFDGMELLDFAGPAEVFADAADGQAFEVFTVGVSTKPIVSQGLAQMTPRYSIEDCPKADIVVIPGGGMSRLTADEKVVDWLRRSAKDAELTMSVCTGALLLARAGLLDDQAATTHWDFIDRLKQAAPKTNVQAGRRFVDNGKIITAAGISAGIDASLHVVDRLLGRKVAEETAKFMEYRWEPPSGPSR